MNDVNGEIIHRIVALLCALHLLLYIVKHEQV